MLAHFMPFSHMNPLQHKGETLKDMFCQTPFSNHSWSVMNNWNAIHECKDAQEAERLKKKDNVLKTSCAFAKEAGTKIPSHYYEHPEDYATMSDPEPNFAVQYLQIQDSLI